MSENNNIDRIQEPDAFDVFLSFATEVRKTNLYKDFKHRMMREVKDWREEYYNFYCRWQDDKNSENIKSEAIAWWLLFTDKEYQRNGQFELLNDLEDYITNNGVRIDVVRYSEWIKWLNNSLKQLEQTANTMKRDDYLLNLFQKNEAIYDKFFERCEGKEKINIVIELIAVAIAIKSEDEYIAYLLERGKNLITLYNRLSKHFVLASYASFTKAITEYKSMPKERQYKINNAKKEYQKLLSQKLQDITTITTFAL